MKVAFVVPDPKIKEMGRNTPPFNLGYLASFLRKYNPEFEIKIIDGLIGENVEKEIFCFQPDIVGVTATTPQAPSAYELADMLRRNRPDIFTVIGGVHASVCPQEALEHFDCVVVGEGEYAIVEIVNGLKQKKDLPKIIYGKSIDDLDDIPMPAYDLMNIPAYLKYGDSPTPNLPRPVMGILTSRGCPFNCAFCYNSYRSTKPRWFSAERVVEEVKYLVEHYGVRSFFFNDDEFLINRKRLLRLANLFDKEKLSDKIVWGCQARVESITHENLQLVKKMNCVMISSGFENGVQRILTFLKKGAEVEKSNRAIQVATSEGFVYGGGIVFGSPGETLDEMKETVEWVFNSRIQFVGLNTLIPYPGTEVWKVAAKNGLLPENVDYRRLVPTAFPEKTYVINDAVSVIKYRRFMGDIYRLFYILSRVRLQPTLRNFLRLMFLPTWWRVFFSHPKKMFRLFGELRK